MHLTVTCTLDDDDRLNTISGGTYCTATILSSKSDLCSLIDALIFAADLSSFLLQSRVSCNLNNRLPDNGRGTTWKFFPKMI